MATGDDRAGARSELDASGLRIALVRARWNDLLVERLASGSHRVATGLGASVEEVSAPGSFELPFAADAVARSGRVDAIVVLGAVIRGETTHYELVSENCASGVMRVQLDTGIPIGFGVLTVENHTQAMARSEITDDGHNVGAEATAAALEMAVLRRSWRP